MKRYEFKSQNENGFIVAESCNRIDGMMAYLGFFRHDRVEFLVDEKVVKVITNVISLKEREL